MTTAARRRNRTDPKTENRQLRAQFKIMGLEVDEVIYACPERLDHENRRLRSLLEWVMAYRLYRSRAAMEEKGFFYPPVEPGMDPDSDWLIFEAWMQGKPVSWTFEGVYGRMTPPEDLVDREIQTKLVELLARLAERGVHVDLEAGVPARLAYSELRAYLLQAEFEIHAPGVTTHIGCSSYCPECFQRPWCGVGMEERWREDDETGAMAFPLACRPYVG
jgi:hypothetical protein